MEDLCKTHQPEQEQVGKQHQNSLPLIKRIALLCFVPFHLALSTMHSLGVRLDWNGKLKLFYYLVYFYYYSQVPLHFLVLFMVLLYYFN